VYRLEKWKAGLRHELPLWFEILSEIEALSSLGNLWYNNPEWIMPELNQAGEFSALDCLTVGMLHNLLTAKTPVRVIDAIFLRFDLSFGFQI